MTAGCCLYLLDKNLNVPLPTLCSLRCRKIKTRLSALYGLVFFFAVAWTVFAGTLERHNKNMKITNVFAGRRLFSSSRSERPRMSGGILAVNSCPIPRLAVGRFGYEQLTLCSAKFDLLKCDYGVICSIPFKFSTWSRCLFIIAFISILYIHLVVIVNFYLRTSSANTYLPTYLPLNSRGLKPI